MHSSKHWGGRTAFIFATAAAAVGLGNIWRFPYLVGQNGGGAFVLIYLAAVLLMGLPLMLAEMTIGKKGQANPVTSISKLAVESGGRSVWGLVGGLGIIISFLVLSYYLVISGWVLDYFFRAIAGHFHHATQASSFAAFESLKNKPFQMLLTDSLVAAGMIGVLILGLKAGLERAVLVLFPALLLLLLLLLLYAINCGGFSAGLSYLFHPDFSKITGKQCLEAVGQAFFSLNIGLAVTIMYSAYLPKNTKLFSSACWVTFADTAIALLAGLIIFPIVFAYHLHPDAGPSLIFRTIPIAFGNMQGGYIVGCLFFLLLFVAAFTSVLSLLEPAISWTMERLHWSRKKATVCCGVLCWFVSILTCFSFKTGHFTLGGLSVFELLDGLTGRFLIPLSGLFVAVFAGWRLSKKLIDSAFCPGTDGIMRQVWIWLLRVVAPLVILVILIQSTGG